MLFAERRLGSEGQAFRKSERSVGRPIPRTKQEVFAFGPLHAERARRFYQSQRTQLIHQFRKVMIVPYVPNYDPMQVSGHRQTKVTEGVYFPGEVSGRSRNQTALYTDSCKSQVPVPGTSQPFETVLKIIQIAPRPSRRQPTDTKASIGFGEKLLYHTEKRGSMKKSHDFQDGCEVDLSNSPIFQIL